MVEYSAGPAGLPVLDVFDAIVVGGGICGAAIFHRLARSGHRVLLIEKSRFAQGATGWCSGILSCCHESEKLTALACASLQSFLELESQGGPKLQRRGALHFVRPGHEGRAQERIQGMRDFVAVQWLDAGQGARLFPQVRWTGLAGAVFEPDAGHMDAAAVSRFWIHQGRSLGQLALEGVEFRGVARHGGNVVGVYSSAGLLRGRRVIFCAGAWTRKLASQAGLAPPANIFSRSLQTDTFATHQFVGDHPAYWDPELGIWGRADGPCLIQTVMALPDWNVDPDHHSGNAPPRRNDARDLASRRFHWSGPAQAAGGGLRQDAFTPDGEGVVAADARMPGLFWATGFSGHGFRIAPGVAAQVDALAFAAAH